LVGLIFSFQLVKLWVYNPDSSGKQTAVEPLLFNQKKSDCKEAPFVDIKMWL
jgi:hypothetical protein